MLITNLVFLLATICIELWDKQYHWSNMRERGKWWVFTGLKPYTFCYPGRCLKPVRLEDTTHFRSASECVITDASSLEYFFTNPERSQGKGFIGKKVAETISERHMSTQLYLLIPNIHVIFVWNQAGIILFKNHWISVKNSISWVPRVVLVQKVLYCTLNFKFKRVLLEKAHWIAYSIKKISLDHLEKL